MEAGIGLKRNQPDRRVEFPQAAARPDKGPARSQPGHEVRELAVNLPDNLRPGRLVVGLPVGVVIILVRIEIQFRIVPVKFTGFLNRPVGRAVRIGQDQLGPISLQNLLSLAAGVGRQAQSDFVAAMGADHGVGDPRVAARGVQDDLPRTQRAAALAFEDHIKRGAVLDRASRVEPLRLGVDFNRRHGARHPRQLQQRRVAYTRQQVAAQPGYLRHRICRYPTGHKRLSATMRAIPSAEDLPAANRIH